MFHRYLKYLSLLLLDMVAIPVAWFSAWFFVANFDFSAINYESFFAGLSFLVLIQGLNYFLFSLYRGVWRFASIQDFIRIIYSACVASITIAFLFRVINFDYKPNLILPLYFFSLTGILGASRVAYRSFIQYKNKRTHGRPVIIIGAGKAGELLLRDLLSDNTNEYNPIGFVDDDYKKQGREIHGVRVLGRLDDIPFLALKHDVKQLLVAIPSASPSLMRRIITISSQAKIPARTLPSLNHLATRNISVNVLRDVSLDDLLGREPITLDWQNIIDSLLDKIILVTGGGGSIGSVLCQQIARLNPELLVVVDHSEFNLYCLQTFLDTNFPNVSVRYELANVTNAERVKRIFKTYRPQVVFHAAAYKHVPLLENQIESAIFNNILGTQIIVDAAIAEHVKKFVLISTDKAVNPTNIMGATKRAAEIYCQSPAENTTTKFITVRFGNVLGSAGSVIPLFKKQIEQGGPVTVTHPDTMRYFMTIPEACQLIMQAFAMGEGSEIFVLEMGKPVKIKDLAEQLILLSGHQVNHDIHIQYIGLRPGEKMIEELFHDQEELVPTKHNKIRQASSRIMQKQQVDKLFAEMAGAYHEFDRNKMLTILNLIVPEYGHSTINDLNESFSKAG